MLSGWEREVALVHAKVHVIRISIALARVFDCSVQNLCQNLLSPAHAEKFDVRVREVDVLEPLPELRDPFFARIVDR